jgi:hypothetical protein
VDKFFKKKMHVPSTFNFPTIVNEALAICPITKKGKTFDHFGNAYTEEESDKALEDYVLNGLVENLAEYADAVTHAFTDAVGTIDPSVTVGSITTSSSAANIAFIACYAEVPENRENALALITNWRNVALSVN